MPQKSPADLLIDNGFLVLVTGIVMGFVVRQRPGARRLLWLHAPTRIVAEILLLSGTEGISLLAAGFMLLPRRLTGQIQIRPIEVSWARSLAWTRLGCLKKRLRNFILKNDLLKQIQNFANSNPLLNTISDLSWSGEGRLNRWHVVVWDRSSLSGSVAGPRHLWAIVVLPRWRLTSLVIKRYFGWSTGIVRGRTGWVGG